MVLPPELKRYEKAIRDAIVAAIPVNVGMTVDVRTKRPRTSKGA